jgi:hypothetical protein
VNMVANRLPRIRIDNIWKRRFIDRSSGNRKTAYTNFALVTSNRNFRFYELIVHNFPVVVQARRSAMMPTGMRELQTLPGDYMMSITRRRMCALLPALLPLAAQLQAFGEDNSLPSGAFTFDKAPMHVPSNNAQVRLMLREKRDRRGIKYTRPRCLRVAHPPLPLIISALGDVAYRGNDRAYRE